MGFTGEKGPETKPEERPREDRKAAVAQKLGEQAAKGAGVDKKK